MPVKPHFEWQQDRQFVYITVDFKGVGKEAVDVFISRVFVKVNAAAVYLLSLDLLHPVDVDKSQHYFSQPSGEATEATLRLHLQLAKLVTNPPAEKTEKSEEEEEEGEVWTALTLSGVPKKELLERRQTSMREAEERYTSKLQSRRDQQEKEKRRLTEAQWEVERDTRRVVEERVTQERQAVERDLKEWEETVEATTEQDKPTNAAASGGPPRTPADLVAGAAVVPERETAVPAVRQTDTVNIAVQFTPKYLALPTRSRGDEAYYRQSRYKPVSVEDSPLFWKEKGDHHYQRAVSACSNSEERRLTPEAVTAFKEAIHCYTESMKRDGVFLTCLMNRAACHLQLLSCQKCIEDCTLGLTMVSNTPASDMTQDRYRSVLTRLYSRRATAYAWAGQYVLALTDLKMAAAYNITEEEEANDNTHTIEKDLTVLMAIMKEKNISTHHDTSVTSVPYSEEMQRAAQHYYKHEYAEAVAVYDTILEAAPAYPQARSNRVCALLLLKKFKPALEDCLYLIELYKEVAGALQHGDNGGGVREEEYHSDDSDATDEEEEEEELLSQKESTTPQTTATTRRQRREATKLLGEKTSQVYLLLKAYVRAAASLCGLQDYAQAVVFMEQAVRITPYDNDLQEDYQRLVEKVRMETLVTASTGVKRS
ncbi:TPR Domain containing protein [Angomonas deanei]|uniref:CS domain containing protein, putative n=1 Tax=Angomonas deanei TaxID=59799 RepID=A0A7G2C978_9TRYP|nr:TPR Domain containing protein [Angomonas deanei]CAD2216099.1 CS domain containing protein, putative [Angomonas deanei]|eukprot:EPY24649.1 TPR Domain containing protein [Angomonas deanei]